MDWHHLFALLLPHARAGALTLHIYLAGFLGALFGSTNATATTRYAQMQVQTSAQGVPVPILWGTQRLAVNLIWYGNFQSKKVTQGKGGKGGGKGGNTYTYTAAVMMGLCEGPLTNMNLAYPALYATALTYIGQVWVDQAQLTTLYALALTPFQGTATQAVWSYLTSSFPAQAVSYSSLAYLASSDYQLGYSPSLPNHGFECFGLYTGSYTRLGEGFAVSPTFIGNLKIVPFAGGAVYTSSDSYFAGQEFTFEGVFGDTLVFTPQISGSRGAGTLTLVAGAGPGPISYTAAAPISVPVLDANPADVVFDFLTNPQYSIGLTSAQVDAASLSAYKTYCAAQGIFFSPLLDSQEQMSQTLDRWASLTNTMIFWSGGVLKFVPLGDAPVTNANVTNGPNYNSGISASLAYTPNLTVQYDLTYDDFIDTAKQGGSGGGGAKPPLQVTRLDPADAPNHVKIEIKDRANAYNAAPVEWQDQGLVDQFGQIDSPVTEAHEICDQTVAAIVVQLVGQRLAYLRNSYAFTLGAEFSLLEPGDIVTLTDPHLGIARQPVRIKTIDEDDKFNLAVVAEEFPGSLGTVVPVIAQSAGGSTGYNQFADPGDVNPPAVFEPNSALTGGQAQVFIAASGGANWGGAAVLVSFDGTTYSPMGTLTAPTQQGVLSANLADHADPDTVDTLSVDLTESLGVLPTNATNADADAFRTLCLVTAAYSTTVPDNGELLAYGNVAQGAGPNLFDLTYLRRALYGTAHAAHGSGAFFSRINLNEGGMIGNSYVVFDLPVAYIGKTIYLKFLSFNTFGNELQDASSVVAYAYTTTGAGYGAGSGGIPSVPTGLTATGIAGGVVLAWSANPSTDNVTSYTVLRGGTPIWTGNATTFTDTSGTVGTSYTYTVEATNTAGTSAASSGASASSLPAATAGGRSITVSTSSVTLLASDSYVGINNTSGGVIAVNPPASPSTNQTISLADEGGNAGTHNWTVNGVTSAVAVNSGGITLHWTGTAWFQVY